MDNVTLKDILGIEEIDFEMITMAYSRLPNPEKYYYQGKGVIYEIPIFSMEPFSFGSDFNLLGEDTIEPEVFIFRFEIKFDKGKPYWIPLKKVYIEK